MTSLIPRCKASSVIPCNAPATHQYKRKWEQPREHGGTFTYTYEIVDMCEKHWLVRVAIMERDKDG